MHCQIDYRSKNLFCFFRAIRRNPSSNGAFAPFADIDVQAGETPDADLVPLGVPLEIALIWHLLTTVRHCAFHEKCNWKFEPKRLTVGRTIKKCPTGLAWYRFLTYIRDRFSVVKYFAVILEILRFGDITHHRGIQHLAKPSLWSDIRINTQP